MQFNKIPTTSYVNETKRWGHDFTRNRGGNIQTLEPILLRQMSKGKPIRLSTTHFVFCAQSFRNWLGKLMHGDGKSMGVEFEFGKPPIFGKRVFDLLGK